MPLLEKELVRCVQCGAHLETDTTALGCLNCLLDGGLNEPPASSRRFQHYEVCLRDNGLTLYELGRGAMGITYRALDLNLDSPVALKVINAAYSDKPEARERFRREARAAAQLRHPNVASVFHFGETIEGEFFYAMELVEGETLEDRVRRNGPLTASLVLDVAEQVCRALIAAEGHRLVHRDLKPSNLMVVPHELSGTEALLVKVIDFGLAQAVVALQDDGGAIHPSFSGTPEFASPEQFNSSATSLDARSDIYSLGATLWYLLCGKTPFTGDVLAEVRNQQLHRQLPLEHLTITKVPAPVALLLRSMLATNPDARPQSARELLKAVRGCREAVEVGPRRRIRLVVAASVLALLVLSALGLTSYLSHRQQVSAVVAAPERSIAVLPFENLSDEKEHAFFADGVHEDIITSLARIAELRVVSNTSVTQYRDTKKTLHQIAEELHVAYVLEGSVRRAGNAVRVTGQLIEARTDRQIWAKSYERELTDIFAIQSALAIEIADALRIAIPPAEKKSALTAPPTTVPAAYDLYLHARTALDDPTISETDKPLRTAETLLRSAVDLDPAFAVAWAQLADVYARFSFNNYDAERLALASSAMEKALKLAPDNPDVIRNLGAYYYHHWDYARAEEQYRRVLHQQPNDAYAHNFLGVLLRRQGKWNETLAETGRAAELEPGNLYLQVTDFHYRVFAARRYAEAEARAHTVAAAEHDPLGEFALDSRELPFVARGSTKELEDYLNGLPADVKRLPKYAIFLRELAIFKGDWAEAARLDRLQPKPWSYDQYVDVATTLAALGRTEEMREVLKGKLNELHARLELDARNADLWGQLARMEALLGHREEALQAVDRRRALLPADDVVEQTAQRALFAFVCIWTDDKDRALAELGLMVREPFDEPVNIMRTSPDYAPLHGDRRFEAIVNDPANRLPLF